MTCQSTYNPKSGIEKWIDQRQPLPRLMHDTMQTFPTPRNIYIWYTFGGILTFCLAVQIVTGIVPQDPRNSTLYFTARIHKCAGGRGTGVFRPPAHSA